jgi:hypothetical protein
MSLNRQRRISAPLYTTCASGWRALLLCATLIVSPPLLPAAAQGADVQESAALPASAVQASPLAVDADATSAQSGKKSAHTQRARERRAERESVKARTNRPARPPRKKSAYDLLMEALHEKAPETLCEEARKAPIRNLVFRIDGKEETTYVLRPNSALGGFDDEQQLAVARQAFGSWEGGPTPHTRTLDLIYAAMLHFDVPYVHLISGIRKDRGGSRHSHGLAADVVLPGVEDEELAAFFRAQGFVGVGTYPRSGFVHIDTRDHSYFWIDRSSPGRRGKVVAVRGEEAKMVDEAALVRGNTGFVNPPRLQRALTVRASRRRAAQVVRQQREAVQQMAAGQPQSSELQTH